MDQMLLGAIATAAIVAGLFFFRFWRSTRDRFFLFFALAFWIEALSRIHLGISGHQIEDTPIDYLLRLIAYGLILIAIIDKNRPRRNPTDRG
jgi:hypothetical protein